MKKQSRIGVRKLTKKSSDGHCVVRAPLQGTFKTERSVQSIEQTDTGREPVPVSMRIADGGEREIEARPNLTYVDSLSAALHETMSGLADGGFVDPHTVSDFEARSTVRVPSYTAEDVRAIREREHATQSVFALHLGVSVNTVSQWERGERAVSGAAAKLLFLVEKHGLAYIL